MNNEEILEKVHDIGCVLHDFQGCDVISNSMLFHTGEVAHNYISTIYRKFPADWIRHNATTPETLLEKLKEEVNKTVIQNKKKKDESNII